MQQVALNKAIQRFRKVIKFAIGHDFLGKDPFLLYKFKTVRKEKLFFKNRKEFKKEVLLLLNSKNSLKRVRKSKRIFNELFPEVFNIFSELKKENYKVFPILLMCLESYLILDVVCRRIASEYPSAVLLPVDDCIITTLSNADLVIKIIEDEMDMAIGAKPDLKFENLNEENAQKELNKLRSGVKMSA